MSTTSLRLRAVARFPANISATNGLTADRNNMDVVVRPDFGQLVQVPAVDNPTKTLFLAWDSDIDNYSAISFSNLVSNIQEVIIGAPLAAINDVNPGADQAIYFTGIGEAATFTVSEFVRSVSNAVDDEAYLAAIHAATQEQGAKADTAVQPGELPAFDAAIYETVAGLPEKTIPAGANAIIIDGLAAIDDEQGGLFVATNTGSLDFAASADGRTWYRVSDDRDKAWMALRNRKLLAKADFNLMNAATFNFVTRGDSLTYGQDTTSADRLPPPTGFVEDRAPIQYPQRMHDRLAALTNATITVTNLGYSGDTAKDAFTRWPDKPDADVSYIMIGTNDANGAHGATYAEYCTYLEKLIQRDIMWGIGVVLLTPPSQTLNNSFVLQSQYAQFAKALGEHYGCPVFEGVEVHQYCLPTDVYSDAIHFNKYGYAKFGDAVASFTMSGALSAGIRKVSSEVNMQPIRGTEGIGSYRQGGTFGASGDGGFTSNTSLLGVAENSAWTMAFYLDAEAADVYLTGGTFDGATVELSAPIDGKAINRAVLKSTRQKSVQESTSYVAKTYLLGKKTYAGSFVGRGWKTFTFYGKATGAGTVFINEVFIEPRQLDEVGVQSSIFQPAKEELLVFSLPSSPITADRADINGDVCIPLPKALMGRTQDPGNYFAFGTVEVTIKCVATTSSPPDTGVTKLLLWRDGTSAAGLVMSVIYKSTPLAVEPVAAGVGFTAYNPTLSGPTGLDKTRFPQTTEQGWLYLTFSGMNVGYYMFEFRSMGQENAEATLIY